MKHILPLLLLILLAACAPASMQTSEVSETSEVLPATVTPEATVTSAPSSTPTQKPTSTPEAPEVNMNLEDWKIFFTGLTTFVNGKEGKLIELFTDPRAGIKLNDPEEISKLRPVNPIMILRNDGLITIISEPSFAAERARLGDIIFSSPESGSTAFYANYAISAVSRAYRNGQYGMHVTFGEISSASVPYRTSMIIDLINTLYSEQTSDGTYVTPVMDMPPHFTVRYNDGSGQSEFISLEDAGLIGLDDTNWLDRVLKAGFNEINITAQ